METKRILAITVLTLVCLMFTVFMLERAVSQSVQYDRWLDVNNDGKINMLDVAMVAKAYGTTGTPIDRTDFFEQLLQRISNLETEVNTLALRSVTTDRIADGAVITAKLADGSVTSVKILDGSVIAQDLADGSVISATISNNAVTTTKIAPGAVTASKIADGAILTIKLADGSVTSAKIWDGTITSVDLATGAVAETNIANGAVTWNKLADGAVTTNKIADGAVTSTKIANGAVTWSSIGGKPLEVVAAGYMTAAGVIGKNYNIASAYWDSNYRYYDIWINGVYYFPYNYITIVTCTSTVPRVAVVTPSEYTLRIYIYDSVGNKVQENFQFVVYRVP